ncbi:sulfatase-like hydrolase/transferase [Phocoenobacter skyensis]|uniref:Phosphoethanolamine transferase n=1 Tax=Phocoenobacter skyensis TaxID=97481 RepID=A0A1H7XED7_9PAST|nr:phosphoethanolamine transferase [Pasteurella skyensis]MDP8079682.1 phosphoethanolamine transferase [Pasteurella skyensis]MDP8085618.1 phosphoethanolamine transferase [Pasteurella skyensis]MDP8185399.1 phosphoethanolamine transferase [Pasteurella skyensis]QLB22162.1 hypothetical protein A6B44_02695 [Pasteurella skyensis]SEM32091.1 Phosphoethanolamine transferase for glucans (OPG), alkaline phosphatase superfamily [Pasteurella skyensis]
MFSKLIAYLNRRIFYIWLLLFSFLSTIISPENSLHYAILSTFIFYYLIYAFNERLFTGIIIFLTVTLSLYYPISLHYGSLNSGIVAAFLETNLSESLDFIKKIDITDLSIPLLFIFSSIILIRLKKYNQRSPYNQRKKMLYIALSFVFIFSVVFIPTKYYLMQSNNFDDENKQIWRLSTTPINIISFYANIYESVNNYYTEKHELETIANKPNPWKILSVSPKYKNYVLIIGESARKDYFSTYGFKLPTSPFLDKTKGYINAGYISTAPATYHSLLKSLYFKKGKKTDHSYNIITLAKAAHIETNWLSNQGSIGKYDTVASRVGVSADFFHFTKKGGFNTDDVDDFKLLDQFKRRLIENKSNKKARLFVLHMMGSHNSFCSRLTKDEKKLHFINKKMSCYANTILKTDKFINDVVTLLKETNQESYSLIYFSDHGLNHINKDEKEELDLDYDSKFKSNYNVPFFKISSDDTKRTLVNTKRSAFNFIYGFSEWLGITSSDLKKDYHFFSTKNDENIKVFNFEKNVEYEKLEIDDIPNFNTQK